ncbi:MAG: gamma carbonic anhydrase family protein [Dethiobacteria bacterium]
MILLPFKGKMPRVSKSAFIAPSAALIGDVTIEKGASIWFGAVLRGDIGAIIVKKGANVQDNVVVHTKLEGDTVTIGENSTIGHSAVLHSCTIGRRVIVGIKAVILDDVIVGDEAIIAAGSVVGDKSTIPPRHLAAGVPAEIKKEISGTSLWYVQVGYKSYHELRDEYLKNGIGVVPGE